MSPDFKRCITAWVSRIVRSEITSEDIKLGNVFIHLVNLTGDVHISGNINNPETLHRFFLFLDGNYHFKVSELFKPCSVHRGTVEDTEAFGLCLVVLIACLQSRAKQLFMDAALDLDLETQTLIFYLLREPMSKLSSDQPLTRECVLSVFDSHDKPELLLPDANDCGDTPIKSADYNVAARQSWCGLIDGKASPAVNQPSELLYRSWTAGTDGCSPVLVSDASVFRVPTTVCPRICKVSDAAVSGVSHLNNAFTDIVQNGEHDSTNGVGAHLDGLDVHTGASCPSSPSFYLPKHSDVLPHERSKPRRPAELSLQMPPPAVNFSQQLVPRSMATSFSDFADFSVTHRSNQAPLASPLASLKHFLDSPLWTQKARLRETERDRRRLIADLEKERSYRDEMEGLVSELRRQLEEARVRATEAEAKAARLSRDITALQDQTDELSVCRTELALREDELKSLKQRLNSFQDLLSHSRNLEVENANLRQECADYCQKVDQLTTKLSDVKDRQLIYTEVETLRSKLRDAEAQLAQLLADSEKTEKDARRQQELYNQLKLQQSLAEVRRVANNQFCGMVTVPPYFSSNGKTDSSNCVNDIEFEDAVHPFGRTTSVDATTVAQDFPPLRNGENLGSVLEFELHAARSQISQLQVELEVTRDKLSGRDTKVAQLVDRLDKLTTDLTSLSVQRELAEETAKQTHDCLTSLQDDLATVESRLQIFHPFRPEDATSETDSIFGHFRSITVGISDPLGRIFRLLFDRFQETWHLQIGQVSVLQNTLVESGAQIAKLNAEISSKVQELESTKIRLDQHLIDSARLEDSLRTTIANSEQERSALQTQLQSQSELSKNLENRVLELEAELCNSEKAFLSSKECIQKELDSSNHLLANATERLKALEAQISVFERRNEGEDAGVQTDDFLTKLPLGLPETDYLDRFDGGEGEEQWLSLQNGGNSPPPQQDQSESALQALTADRRGLSNELVRLHDELAESHLCVQQLAEQNAELLEKLAYTESALQRQTTLFTHAQQNWALAERKDRETEERMKQLQTEHAAQLESLRARLLSQPQSDTQIESARAKHAAEKKELKRQLSEAKNELQKLDANRMHLVQRNEDLQRELVITQTLIETILRGQEFALSNRRTLNRDSLRLSTLQNSGSCVNGLLGDWIERTRRMSSHNSVILAQDDDFSESNYSCVSQSNCHKDPSSNGLVSADRCCVSELHNPPHYSNASDVDRPHSIVDEIARLSTRTAMLESFALALSQHKDQPDVSSLKNSQSVIQQPPNPQMHECNHVISNESVVGRPARHSVITDAAPNPPSRIVSTEPNDLDTDADSSAYTDLSQVSVTSRNSPPVGLSVRSAAVHSSPIPTNSSRAQYPQEAALDQSDPVLLKPPVKVCSRTTNDCSLSSKHETMKTEDNSNFIDPSRIPELHRRNRLQPLHLRTCYPVETQTIEPEHVAGALRHLSSKSEEISVSKANQWHSNQPTNTSNFFETHGNVLREMDEDNLSQLHSLSSSFKHSDQSMKTQLKSATKQSSPQAAGYQRRPQNLQELTDALIAASYDPSSLTDALSSELKRTFLALPVSSMNSNSSRAHSLPQSARATTQPSTACSSSSRSGACHSACLSIRPKSEVFVDENVNPPTTNNVNHLNTSGVPFSSHHEVDKRANPSHPTGTFPVHNKQRHSSGDSLESHSLASSTRSIPNSIAFEIPIEPRTGKPGCLPAARVPRPTAARRQRTTQVQKEVITKQPNIIQAGRKNVPFVITSDESFRSLETPLQRNPKCID